MMKQPMSEDPAAPIVTVLVERSSEARFLADGLHSVLSQSVRALEILLPAGTPLSADVAREPRIRTLAPGEDVLATARGRWIGMMDGDDIMHPERLERLIVSAERAGADIAADDILLFEQNQSSPARALLGNMEGSGPRWIELPEVQRAAKPSNRASALVQLRPIFRTERLRSLGASRPTQLVDWKEPALVESLLKRGARFGLYPELTYFRRHAHAGHRLRGSPARRAKPALCVLSRQRVVGNTQGSSTYLISICEAFAEAGFDVHFVCPSPSVFGRWPVLVLQPEMAVFRSIAIHGGWRLGRFVLAKDPMVAIGAFLGAVDRIARRLGFGLGRWGQKAPYSIAVPLTREDALFVAAQAPAKAYAILADYAFLTEAIPYALRPRAPSAVVMHDLFSSRAPQFSRLGGADSVASLDLPQEMRLLARAGAVLAIQSEEAEVVRRNLPNARVILASMAVQPVPAPQPGEGRTILFVGSNTAPNIDGLRWFLEEIWPAIRRAEPDASLQVAGTVSGAFGAPPEGVTFLGRVPDLDPLYRDATVVISPLRVGSGLKIKLVEALGQGKATVATGSTLQGVEEKAGPAVLRADEATEFASAVLRLLQDSALRADRARAALVAARQHFSAEACYRGAIEFLASPQPSGSIEVPNRSAPPAG
jgi:glycosyltransferase involved in cell wall biosynthesis